MPESFAIADLLASVDNESPRMKTILRECLNPTSPSKRPKASDVSARLLDEYNDSCAGPMIANEAKILVNKCRQLVAHCRIDHSLSAKVKLERADVAALVELRDSWDDDGFNLCLAPEVSFILGAGIYLGLIEANDAQVPFSIVGRGAGDMEGY